MGKRSPSVTSHKLRTQFESHWFHTAMQDWFWCTSSLSGNYWNSKIPVGRQAQMLMEWTWERQRFQILTLVPSSGLYQELEAIWNKMMANGSSCTDQVFQNGMFLEWALNISKKDKITFDGGCQKVMCFFSKRRILWVVCVLLIGSYE